jgi:hypothetical protein
MRRPAFFALQNRSPDGIISNVMLMWRNGSAIDL